MTIIIPSEKRKKALENQINLIEIKLKVLDLMEKLEELGVDFIMRTFKKKIIITYSKPIYMKNRNNEDYEYIEANTDYIKCQWDDVLLDLGMLIEELNSKRAYLK